jgi:hypothetical protein
MKIEIMDSHGGGLTVLIAAEGVNAPLALTETLTWDRAWTLYVELHRALKKYRRAHAPHLEDPIEERLRILEERLAASPVHTPSLQPTASLGLATTGELLDEIRLRVNLGGLDYRPVDEA